MKKLLSIICILVMLILLPSLALAEWDENWIEEPGTEGSSGEVLTTDGDGGRTWGTAVPVVGDTLTVGFSGAQYTTITTAIAAASAGDTILVYPGTYTETLTIPANNITIIGMGAASNTILTQADAKLIDFGATTGGHIIGFKLTMTAATTAKNMVQGTTGSFTVKMCNSQLTTAAALNQEDQPRVGKITGAGSISFVLGKVKYTHSGACTTGSALKAPFEADTGGTIYAYNINEIDVNGSGSALATAVGISEGTGNVVVDYCDIDVDDDTATYTVGLGYLSSGTSITNEFSYNIIHVHGADNNAYGALAINSEIRSSHNHIHVECSGSGTTYSFNETGTGEINSHMDDIIATGGSSGNVNMASSDADGNFTASGKVNDVKEMTFAPVQLDAYVTVKDGLYAFVVPDDTNSGGNWDGLELKDVTIAVGTKGVDGAMVVEVVRIREGSTVSMLSTNVTIGDEYYAYDGVVNAANDDIQAGDLILVNCAAVHSTTAAKGFFGTLLFR